MMVGVATIDSAMVLLGGGSRHLGPTLTMWMTRIFALGLAVFGGSLVIRGLRG
jgi:hypothetical protein